MRSCTVREKGEYFSPQHFDTIAQTVRALDGLETTASTNAILRRYHLTRLMEHRNQPLQILPPSQFDRSLSIY
jgi:hypothetical protein